MADLHRSTLLVFTLGPSREQARRRWLGGRFQPLERELHERCLERVLEAGRARGCRLRVCTPDGGSPAADAVGDRQAERHFGERLIGAIRRASAEAAGPLIVVGTDSPELGAGLLERTERALAEDDNRVVVGPSTDGGIYLLASTRPLAEELSAVRWCSRRTADSLIAALRAAGRTVYLLPVLRDLDRRQDLERWLATSPVVPRTWAGLLVALRRALRLLAKIRVVLPPPVPAAAWCRVPVGRAPPR